MALVQNSHLMLGVGMSLAGDYTKCNGGAGSQMQLPLLLVFGDRCSTWWA